MRTIDSSNLPSYQYGSNRHAESFARLTQQQNEAGLWWGSTILKNTKPRQDDDLNLNKVHNRIHLCLRSNYYRIMSIMLVLRSLIDPFLTSTLQGC
jgi:hypothetical protein